MPTEEIVVLANSRKPGGRCVAGISTLTDHWIRPVSNGVTSGALSERDCTVGERMVEALDIVRFDYVEDLEDPAQPENLLIDHSDWVFVRRLSTDEAYGSLQKRLQPGPALLGSTEKGVSDEVAQLGLSASLALIEPDAISFRSEEDPFRPGRRRARALFEIASQPYNLSITDKVVAPVVKGSEDGNYSAADLGFPPDFRTILTVSLAEPLDGTRWKLVAAVLFLP